MKDKTKVEERELTGVELKSKPYQKPVLKQFGKVSDLTAGPSIGVGESGNPTVFKNPG